MKFCQMHWDKLKDAIQKRGIWHLVARSGKEAVQRAVQEVEGTATDATYDPLMGAHWAIMCRALELGGLYLMSGKPDGTEYCPVCEAMERSKIEPTSTSEESFRSKEEVESHWIDGPADAELKYAKERGLIPTPGVPEASA